MTQCHYHHPVSLSSGPLLVHFAATLAHRIRNPLSGISTAVQLLQMQSGSQSYLCELISQEIKLLDEIVGEMLRFADQQMEPAQELQLEGALLPQLPCGRDFVVSGLDEQLYVVCRPLELSSVLHVLVHYMHAVICDDKPLYIDVRRISAQPQPHLCLRFAEADLPGIKIVTAREGWFGDEELVPGSTMGLDLVQTTLLSYGLHLRAQRDECDRRILVAELPITPLDCSP